MNGSVSLRGVPAKVLVRSRAQVPGNVLVQSLAEIVSWLLLPLSRKRLPSLIYSFFVDSVRLYDSDIIPFYGLSGLLVLVDGLLGEVPVRPVGAPEETKLAEAVKCL